MGKTELLPILMENLHTPVEPKQLHPMLLDDAYPGAIVAFDCRERLLTIQVDEMPSGKPGHRLGSRAILVFTPESEVETPTIEMALRALVSRARAMINVPREAPVSEWPSDTEIDAWLADAAVLVR